MLLFKCKMCGGDLEIAEGVAVAECEYCGTKQTVPRAVDENLQNLFNRANTLRIKSEFDKAEKLYEKIIQADASQSEAYWGLILCKHGIEYVDDPNTFKKIPTCHRASYDSIIADDDYKSALKNADMSQRIIYEEQAKEIDRIQKEILALAQKEETYDVFICYKETDVDGRRTQDSVIANDIYHQLKQEGFNVFYAAITLEGKLGTAYEPIIFAALNSAKVMLSLGTKPEYFNAVWVKNEWSRFLKIIKNDRSKLLIPCYRDMDAYELPEEFAHLQAQDMSKIGFINDIVRGIKKVVKKDEDRTADAVKDIVPPVNTNIELLLKRAFMFLEDGEYKSADEYCEKVLDLEPTNALAYLGKFMADEEVGKMEDLAVKAIPSRKFSDKLYEKAKRFATGDLKSFLENLPKENAYNRAKKMMENGYFADAENGFSVISGYKDSDQLRKKCHEKHIIQEKEKYYKIAITTDSPEEAMDALKRIRGYKDVDQLIIECKNIIRKRDEERRKQESIKRKIESLDEELGNQHEKNKECDKKIKGLKNGEIVYKEYRKKKIAAFCWGTATIASLILCVYFLKMAFQDYEFVHILIGIGAMSVGIFLIVLWGMCNSLASVDKNFLTESFKDDYKTQDFFPKQIEIVEKERISVLEEIEKLKKEKEALEIELNT